MPYADHALQLAASALENVEVGRDTFRIRIAAPEMAKRFLPGQFLMMRLPGLTDPLLGRPLALYDVICDKNGDPFALDIVYLTIGKFTRRLAHAREGDEVIVWGPLGNGFAAEPADTLILVAGGIGQTPLLAVAAEYLGHRRYGDPPREPARARRAILCYGARSAVYHAGVGDFEKLGVEVRLATDDGSGGYHGLVTGLLPDLLAETGQRDAGRRLILTCGPEPMMEAVAGIAAANHLPCRVSLETPMACGIGVCFSCVAKVRQADGTWDYRRTCVEGPVFNAAEMVWD